ncbi:recombination regulator RecX [Histophilus somni]|uniref:Regulatory protein RecX n=1 Tax=Histophilus somni TaxID=731 RepID=A0A9Q7E8J7_HISSO|nr:recombination regulator RecX [Histophilus somni]ARU64496.1 recombination regulator RecX [Histophilus somni]ARU66281.1 recombination regulator RecX [Histophilus somni]ARU68157.1 recombination regulator RecX [Histophilus somni]ARU70036.1 recombination regulator RecX [Histophilus somni]ARU71912.1 recombination regulator RecX [Histophilus somni]
MSSLALGYVMSLLARREYSEFELRCKMQEKRFTEQEITQTLTHCQQKNWQNDKRFAENYLYYRAKRGYGLQRIRQELYQLKGIPAELINEIEQESEIDWNEIVLQVLNKKFPYYRDKLDSRAKQKIWRYMLSHGFSHDDFANYVATGKDNYSLD